MELRFANDIRISQRGEYIVIGNEKTGHWIKVTKECYDIIRNAVLKQWSVVDLVADMSDQEDRQYMAELIERLQKMRIIVSDEDTIENAINNVTFCITNRCNLRCHHCSVSASSDNNDYFIIIMVLTEEGIEVAKAINDAIPPYDRYTPRINIPEHQKRVY